MATHNYTAVPGITASVTVQFLPACPRCRHPHPTVSRQDPDVCPGCGGPAATPGAPQLADAHLSLRGLFGLLAKALLHTGQWLFDLAKRI